MFFSEAMLKKKIRLWDLHRNLKEADMRHALRLYYERESQGKRTVFLVRNRLVPFEEIKRYFHRKGVDNLRSLAHSAFSGARTTHITCRTPAPQGSVSEYPPLTQVDQLGSSIPGGNTIAATTDPNLMDMSLALPSPFHRLDQLLLLGRKYYDAICEDTNRRHKSLHCEVGEVEIFFHHIANGQKLLTANPDTHMAEAFAHFDAGCNMVRTVLDRGTLLFLPYVCYLLLVSGTERQNKIICHLLQFASSMARESPMQLHPLAHSLAVLSELPPSQWIGLSKPLLQSLVDRLRVEFEGDMIPEDQLDEINICRPQSVANIFKHKITSIAVGKLSKDIQSSFPNDGYGIHRALQQKIDFCPEEEEGRGTMEDERRMLNEVGRRRGKREEGRKNGSRMVVGWHNPRFNVGRGGHR